MEGNHLQSKGSFAAGKKTIIMYTVFHGLSVLAAIIYLQATFGWLEVIFKGCDLISYGLILLYGLYRRGLRWTRTLLIVWDVLTVVSISYSDLAARIELIHLPLRANLSGLMLYGLRACGIFLLLLTWKRLTPYLDYKNQKWKSELEESFREQPHQAFIEGAQQAKHSSIYFIGVSTLVLLIVFWILKDSLSYIEYGGLTLTYRGFVAVLFFQRLVYFFLLRHVESAKTGYSYFVQGCLILLAWDSALNGILRIIISHDGWFDSEQHFFLGCMLLGTAAAAGITLCHLCDRKTAYYVYCKNELKLEDMPVSKGGEGVLDTSTPTES